MSWAPSCDGTFPHGTRVSGQPCCPPRLQSSDIHPHSRSALVAKPFPLSMFKEAYLAHGRTVAKPESDEATEIAALVWSAQEQRPDDGVIRRTCAELDRTYFARTRNLEPSGRFSVITQWHFVHLMLISSTFRVGA